MGEAILTAGAAAEQRAVDWTIAWYQGRPMIVTFSTCVDSIRTVPFLQHDADRPEDILTASEDHAADE